MRIERKKILISQELLCNVEALFNYTEIGVYAMSLD